MSDQDTSPSAMRPIAVLEPGTLAQTPLTEMHLHAEHAAGAAEAAGQKASFGKCMTLFTRIKPRLTTGTSCSTQLR